MTSMSEFANEPVQKGWSMPGVLLRLEGAAVFAAAIALYAYQDYGWLFFILCLFLPDLSIAAYGLNSRVGSIFYNAVHNYAVPLLLGLLALVAGWSLGIQLALIWVAHIGMDRTLGFGLKYPDDFKNTHFGRI